MTDGIGGSRGTQLLRPKVRGRMGRIPTLFAGGICGERLQKAFVDYQGVEVDFCWFLCGKRG
jgi:hypothetical protein